MIKKFKSLIILVLMLVLCGCTRGGIGDKVIVKAIFLEKSSQIMVRLLVIKATPSADAGNADESTELLVGNGSTLFEAFQQAEEAYSGDVFYGQNELLLIGPSLQQNDIFESCRYLAKNSSGRPNMAVYGIDLESDDIEDLTEYGEIFLNHIDQISQRNCYKTFLYQLTNYEGNGILPLLHYDANGNVVQTGLKIYQKNKEIFQWYDTKETLATLFSGQTGDVKTLELYENHQKIILDLRTPKVFYECTKQGNSLVLQIKLTGHIQNILGVNGLYSQDEKKQLLDVINQHIEAVAKEMFSSSFTSELDLFSLQSWFYNQSQTLTEKMKINHTLYQPDRIQFNSELKII